MHRNSVDILSERRRIWNSKKIIKKLYRKWYGVVAEGLTPGITLELGGGSGNLKEFFPGTISSDVLFAPWLDAVLDGQALPFRNESLDSIVLFDVLHHFDEPALFFSEAQRALKPKGRIVLMEPYVSWSSFFVYEFLHAEGMVWRMDPYEKKKRGGEKHPFSGNQAIPTLIFEKQRKEFRNRFSRLQIIKEEKLDFIIYPLSGGFHNPSFLPLVLYPVFEFIEKLLRPLGRFLAFRIFVILEKR